MYGPTGHIAACLLALSVWEHSGKEHLIKHIHTSLCSFDYQVINYHSILNIMYSTIQLSLLESFFLFSS